MSTFIALGLLALPILDVISLIKAGAVLGFLPTLALVLAAGTLGTWLVRHQGFAVGRSVQASVAEGRLPVVAAFDGACLLVAGGLLVFPGLVSDALALALLIPPVRALLRRAAARWLRAQSTAVVWTTDASGVRRPTAGGDVIDGEYQEIIPPEGNPTSPHPSSQDSEKTLPVSTVSRPTIVRPSDP